MTTLSRRSILFLIVTAVCAWYAIVPVPVQAQADLSGMSQAQIDSLNNGLPMQLDGGPGFQIGFLNTPYTGYVFGASTTASTTLPELPAGCTPMLQKFMRKARMGIDNDTNEVMKLQKFLNEKISANLPITGEFGPLTDAAVKKFQETHLEQILAPWGINAGTGFVYLTTQRWINLMSCPNLDLPMPKLVPFVRTN